MQILFFILLQAKYVKKNQRKMNKVTIQ